MKWKNVLIIIFLCLLFFLAGSTLEGILLSYALSNIQIYNQANSSPKKDGKVKRLYDWTLNDLINVSTEIGFIKEDTKNLVHV